MTEVSPNSYKDLSSMGGISVADMPDKNLN